jgi:transposase-like protein
MDTRKYRIYSKEIKLEALERLESSGKSVSALERELGITTGLLPKWKQRYTVDKSQHSLEPSDSQPGARHLKKSHGHLLERTEQRYRFMSDYRREFSVGRVAQRLLCVA